MERLLRLRLRRPLLELLLGLRELEWLILSLLFIPDRLACERVRELDGDFSALQGAPALVSLLSPAT